MMLVLLARLDQQELPDQLTRAKDVASRYWRDATASVEELTEANVAVWAFLDATDQVTAPEGEVAHLGRATLCVLDPAGDEEVRSDLADWFATWVYGEGAEF